MIRYPGTPKHKSVLISSFDLDYFAEPPVFIFHEIKPRTGVTNYPIRGGGAIRNTTSNMICKLG